MFIAFLLEGVGIIALAHLGTDPFWFVVLSGAVFFAWGEIYSLFPATCTDTCGSRYATTNSGLLYTAKGVAALLVPLSSNVATARGWQVVYLSAATMNFTAAAAALVVLKPLRARLLVAR